MGIGSILNSKIKKNFTDTFCIMELLVGLLVVPIALFLALARQLPLLVVGNLETKISRKMLL
jgi:hypothetical protein